MNLHTTLKAYNEVSPLTKEQVLVLKEAQSILDNSAQKDLSILDKLGMNANLREYQRITTENEQASKFDEIYDISAIRKTAINYGLRFLPSDMYNGTIDPCLPAIMNRFCEKNNISIAAVTPTTDYNWQGRLQTKGNRTQFTTTHASQYYTGRHGAKRKTVHLMCVLIRIIVRLYWRVGMVGVLFIRR